MNYKLVSLQNSPRVILKDVLSISGAEISINTLTAGANVPFVHSHKENEEIYLILKGDGKLYIDGEEIDIEEGDAFCIKPAGKRAIKANSELKFICIQVKEASLSHHTQTDGIIHDNIKPSWFK